MTSLFTILRRINSSPSMTLKPLKLIGYRNAAKWDSSAPSFLRTKASTSLAGSEEATTKFRALVDAEKDPRFADLDFKESWSEQRPFNRMLIKVKKEIISMGVPEIDPSKHEPKFIEAKELKKWYEEGKKFRILDTRNDYEIRIGTFKDAEHLDLQTFRASRRQPRQSPKNKKPSRW